jgi:hypothetical protein
MQGHKLREQLVLKPVSIKYLDQYNELLRYVFRLPMKNWIKVVMKTAK